MPRVSEIISIKETFGETLGFYGLPFFTLSLTCLSSEDAVNDLDYAVSLEEAG